MKSDPSAPSGLDTLLYTKLDVPLLGARVIRRERLTERLQAALRQPVTLLVAPTGYGKTTLLCEWLSTQPHGAMRHVWVSLDSFDNAPLRLWSYVAAGLQRIHPQARFEPRNLMQRSLGPLDPALLHPLFNEIARVPHPVGLILDDYQAITDPAVHRLVDYLIEHQPNNLRLVIASRTAPQLHLSRLRAQNRLVEITTHDLAFTMGETRAFLTGVLGLEADPGQAAALWGSSEGWVAGLQLAALSMNGRRGVRPISNSARCCGLPEVVDYLSEEVLSQLDPHTRESLLRTSILSDLTAPLCQALLDTGSGQAFLSKLAEDNLFVSALDDRAQWFRYHPLFAEALQTQLELDAPELIPVLHRRACDWLLAHGFSVRAVGHALAAGDLDRAAEIADACAMQAIIAYDLNSVIQWISRFSEAMLQRRPRLGVYFALTTFLLGRVDEVEDDLAHAERLLAAARDQLGDDAALVVVRWELDVIRAAASCWNAPTRPDLARIQTLLEQAPPDDIFFIGFLNHSLAVSLDTLGRLEAAAATFEKGRQFALAHALHIQYVHSARELADIRKRQGRLGDAEQELERTLAFARQHELDPGILALTLSGLIEIAVERDALERARPWVNEVVADLDRIETYPSCWTFLEHMAARLARYFLAQRDFDQARRFTRQALSEFVVRGAIPVRVAEGTVLPQRSGSLLARLVVGALSETQVDTGGASDTLFAQMTSIRVAISRGPAPQALEALERIAEMARTSGGIELLLELRVLQALAHRGNGDDAQALRSLGEALGMARPEGYRRVFVDEGEPMRTLLADYVRTSGAGGPGEPLVAYARELSRAFTAEPEAATPAQPPAANVTAMLAPLLEPLSARERDVLDLLIVDRTTKEIALTLTISVNTVKAHTKSLFRKLGIHQRVQVADRARELGLTSTHPRGAG